MDVRLVVDKGNAEPQTWRLHNKDNVIGRRRDCQLRILSAEVSRRHCMLTIDDGHVSIEDLDSINGTFINGQRVVGKQVVRPGDRLEIGPVEFVVNYDLAESGRSRLAPHRVAVGAHEQDAEVLEVAEPDVQGVVEEATSEAPFAFADDDPNWHLPQTSDLRDLLSQVEKPAPTERRREA
jgi:pSer/pThr/pTyr-binding forkhead associated (FHA) protein